MQFWTSPGDFLGLSICLFAPKRHYRAGEWALMACDNGHPPDLRHQTWTYEIQSPLGAGGMGEVHRAHDTRLDRDVAIEVLPELFGNRFIVNRFVRPDRPSPLTIVLNATNETRK